MKCMAVIKSGKYFVTVIDIVSLTSEVFQILCEEQFLEEVWVQSTIDWVIRFICWEHSGPRQP